MSGLTLDIAHAILAACLDGARKRGLKPVAVAVLDERGALKAAGVEDRTSLKRFEIAQGKAFGAIALGMGSRSIFTRAKDQPYFVAAVGTLAGGNLVPVPGGVLIRSADGTLVGAVGISGDSSDKDETVAIEAIGMVGLVADPGA